MLRVGGVAIRCDGDGAVRSVQRSRRNSTQQQPRQRWQQTRQRGGAGRGRRGAVRGRSSSDGDGELEAMQDYAANMAAEGQAPGVRARSTQLPARRQVCKISTD